MTPDVDVAVVGASCAGLAAARDLAVAGMRTVVLDSRPSFSEPERTWIVTRKLGGLVDFPLGGSVVHETGVMELIANGSRRQVRLEPSDLVVERGALRRVQARAAEDAGAEILLRHRVKQICLSDTGLRIAYTRNGSGSAGVITARHLVGADGVRSIVAESMGARPQRTVPIVQARVRLPADHDPGVTKIWFDPQRTRFFYWLIPESDSHGVVGLIAERPRTARGLLDDFLRSYGYEPLGYQGAVIPLHQLSRRIDWRLNGNRVVLIGDAAAHVKVTTVGGVVSGIWGARAAAAALVRGTSYRRELRPLHRELLLHDTIRWFMNRFEVRDYDRLLRLLNLDLRELLSTHNRDSMASKALALLRAQPGILSLGLAAVASPRRAARKVFSAPPTTLSLPASKLS